MKKQDYPDSPVFIIGAGRSGTKFLRDLLRVSDSVHAIPYDVNYIWKYGNEKLNHDELPIASSTEKKSNYIRRVIFKLSGAGRNNSAIMLDKTVSNSLRIPYVESVFPGARYIHLVRDGRAVTESATRMWTEPPEARYLLSKLRYFPWSNYRYAISYVGNILLGKLSGNRGQKLWGPRYKGINQDLEALSLIEVCAKQWAECVSKATDGLNELPKERVLTLCYEDLLASSDALDNVCNFIGIEDKERVLSAYKKRLKISNLDKWKTALSDEDVRLISPYMSSMLKKYKYT